MGSSILVLNHGSVLLLQAEGKKKHWCHQQQHPRRSWLRWSSTALRSSFREVNRYHRSPTEPTRGAGVGKGGGGWSPTVFSQPPMLTCTQVIQVLCLWIPHWLVPFPGACEYHEVTWGRLLTQSHVVQSLSHYWHFATPWTQHARLPCPSLSPRVCAKSLSWWCHPTISSSVAPFSSCPQSFLASGSFPRSWLFVSVSRRTSEIR